MLGLGESVYFPAQIQYKNWDPLFGRCVRFHEYLLFSTCALTVISVLLFIRQPQLSTLLLSNRDPKSDCRIPYQKGTSSTEASYISAFEHIFYVVGPPSAQPQRSSHFHFSSEILGLKPEFVIGHSQVNDSQNMTPSVFYSSSPLLTYWHRHRLRYYSRVNNFAPYTSSFRCLVHIGNTMRSYVFHYLTLITEWRSSFPTALKIFKARVFLFIRTTRPSQRCRSCFAELYQCRRTTHTTHH